MNEQQWPSHLPDTDKACEWITSVLLGQPEVTGPTVIYAAYDSPPDVRVTARFQVTGKQALRLPDVVFRANHFPLLASSACVHAFLARHCRGVVPEVLDSQEVNGGSNLLYRAFEGEVVEKTRSQDALIETARTLAQIQDAVAIAPEQEKAVLPHLPVGMIPMLFAEMLGNIRVRYETVWAVDDGTLSKWIPFSASEVLTQLEPMQAQVEAWSREMASAVWPETIVHGDLHTGNAVVQPNGSVLIYDWDDAVLSCPFLSVERLLVGAWQMDTNGGGGPWGYVAETPSQAAVRQAYLDAISWGTRPERERAFDIAVCLAVVKEMHHEWKWAEIMGWKDGNPEWTAQLISRLWQHAGRVRNG